MTYQPKPCGACSGSKGRVMTVTDGKTTPPALGQLRGLRGTRRPLNHPRVPRAFASHDLH